MLALALLNYCRSCTQNPTNLTGISHAPASVNDRLLRLLLPEQVGKPRSRPGFDLLQRRPTGGAVREG